MYGGDETNANLNRNETTLNWANIQSALPKWSLFSVVGATTAHSDVLGTADGTAFMTTDPFAPGPIKLWAVNPTTSLLWSLDSQFDSYHPAVGGNHLYVNKPNNAGIVAVDTQTGSPFGVGNGFLAGSNGHAAFPVVANGTIYYQASDSGVIYAVSTSGGLKWSVPTNHADLTVRVSVGGGHVYAIAEITHGMKYTLLALNPTTGKVDWSRDIAASAIGHPVYANGSVYVNYTAIGSVYGQIWRYDASTGIPQVSTSVRNYVISSIGNGTVIAIGDNNGITFHRVLAFDAQTLQLKWTVPLIGLAYGEGAAAMASDFVTLCDGHLHAYQLSSGNGGLFELANLPCDNRPIVAGGKIIYHDPDRHAMTALGLGNGP